MSENIAITPARAPKERFYEIDLLRFIAAFVVVLFHFSYNGFVRGKSPVQFSEIDSVTRYGYLGVELFFIISGFVISMSAESGSAKKFVISRVVRLYPMYWIGCTLSMLALYLLPNAFGKPSLVMYLANMTMFHSFIHIPDMDGVYWTLAYELKFYFIILILLLTKRFKNIDILSAGWLVLSILWHFHVRIPGLGFFIFPEYSSFFISGVLFFLIKRNGWRLHYAVLLFGSYLLSIWVAIHGDLAADPSMLVIGIIVTAMYLVFLAIVTGNFKLGKSEYLSNLGAITYPLYLIHSVIGYILMQNMHGVINKFVLLVGLCILFIVLAFALHLFLEKPFAKKLAAVLNPKPAVAPHTLQNR